MHTRRREALRGAGNATRTALVAPAESGADPLQWGTLRENQAW